MYPTPTTAGTKLAQLGDDYQPRPNSLHHIAQQLRSSHSGSTGPRVA